MKKVKVELKTKREDQTLVTWAGEVEVPESITEAVQLYGDEVCAELLQSQIQTNRMNIARAALRAGGDPGQAAAQYVPGQKRERAPTDPTTAVLQNFLKLDVEARKALIAQLKAKQGQQ